MANTNSKHLTFKPCNKGDIRSPFEVVVIVSKKVAGLAVQRNKLKRRLRELSKEYKLPSGILYTRKGINELTFSELKKEVEELIK